MAAQVIWGGSSSPPLPQPASTVILRLSWTAVTFLAPLRLAGVVQEACVHASEAAAGAAQAPREARAVPWSMAAQATAGDRRFWRRQGVPDSSMNPLVAVRQRKGLWRGQKRAWGQVRAVISSLRPLRVAAPATIDPYIHVTMW